MVRVAAQHAALIVYAARRTPPSRRKASKRRTASPRNTRTDTTSNTEPDPLRGRRPYLLIHLSTVTQFPGRPWSAAEAGADVDREPVQLGSGNDHWCGWHAPHPCGRAPVASKLAGEPELEGPSARRPRRAASGASVRWTMKYSGTITQIRTDAHTLDV